MRKANSSTSTESGLTGRDLYLRLGAGKPIQLFRVWDAERFLQARTDEGCKVLPPYVVTVHTREEYLA